MANNRFNINTSQFALWIAMGSITMMFAAFSSAYMVRQSAGNWLEFQLPNMFFVSTAILLLSSVTLHVSYNSFKKGKESLYKGLLLLTFALGIAFVIFQYEAWMQMFEMGIDMKRNPSGSFVYVISGTHAAHVLGGIACLVVALIHAFALPFNPTKKRKNRFQLVLQYWHFVDILWVYLLLFFVFQR
jgi:cytochrome c oxidase subunit 3